MNEITPKPEINDEAYNAYMTTELGFEEIMDLGHLSREDRLKIDFMLEEAEFGDDPLPDDPTVRAAANAYLAWNPQYGGYHSLDDRDDMDVQPEKTLTLEQLEELLVILEERFKANMDRHPEIEWSQVDTRLKEADPEKLWSLNEMERTGGEPDVIEIVEETGEVEFWDCSRQSPKKRRMVCYDKKGQEEAERKGRSIKHRPRYGTHENAINMAKKTMGLGGILNREQIMKLNKLVKGLLNGSQSWVDTPVEVREKGVANLAITHRDLTVVECEPNGFGWDQGFHGWLRI